MVPAKPGPKQKGVTSVAVSNMGSNQLEEFLGYLPVMSESEWEGEKLGEKVKGFKWKVD